MPNDHWYEQEADITDAGLTHHERSLIREWLYRIAIVALLGIIGFIFWNIEGGL